MRDDIRIESAWDIVTHPRDLYISVFPYEGDGVFAIVVSRYVGNECIPLYVSGPFSACRELALCALEALLISVLEDVMGESAGLPVKAIFAFGEKPKTRLLLGKMHVQEIVELLQYQDAVCTRDLWTLI